MPRIFSLVGAALAVGAIALFGFRLGSSETSVSARFETALATAEELQANAREIKLVYEFREGTSGDFHGTITVARKGERHLFLLHDQASETSYASGEDKDGPFLCFTGDLAILLGELGCREALPSEFEEDNDAVLAMFSGRFTLAGFQELLSDAELHIAESDPEVIAGIPGDCFSVRTKGAGGGRFCFSPDSGILLLIEDDSGPRPSTYRLRTFTFDVSEEDVSRPNISTRPDFQSLALTHWLAAEGAACGLSSGSFQPMALAVAQDGRVWVADYDELVVFDPQDCSMEVIPTGYERRGDPVAGMARSVDGSIVVTRTSGIVFEVLESGEVRELLSKEGQGHDFGGGISGPAVFPDGTISVARVEGESMLKLYRLRYGAPAEVLDTWSAGFVSSGQLLTVPGIGVAFASLEDGTERLYNANGFVGAAGAGNEHRWLHGCVAYASEHVRWEQMADLVVKRTDNQVTEQFAIDLSTDNFGCTAATLSPDNSSLWFVVTYPVPAAGLYEVDLTSPGAPLPPKEAPTGPETLRPPSPPLEGEKLLGEMTYTPPKDGPCGQAGTYGAGVPQIGPDGSVYFLDEIGLRRLTDHCELSTITPKPDDVHLAAFTIDPDGNRYEAFRYGWLGNPVVNIRKVTPDGNVFLLAGQVCAESGGSRATSLPEGVESLATCKAFPTGTPPAGTQIESNPIAGGPMAFHAGSLYLAGVDRATWNNIVSRLDADGSIHVVGILEPSVTGILALVVSPNGEVFTAAYTGGVARIGTNGEIATVRDGHANDCLALDSAGRLWYRDDEGGQGFEVYEEGRLIATPEFPMDWHHYCMGLAFQTDGDLIMISSTGDSGTMVWRFGALDFEDPD